MKARRTNDHALHVWEEEAYWKLLQEQEEIRRYEGRNWNKYGFCAYGTRIEDDQ